MSDTLKAAMKSTPKGFHLAMDLMLDKIHLQLRRGDTTPLFLGVTLRLAQVSFRSSTSFTGEGCNVDSTAPCFGTMTTVLLTNPGPWLSGDDEDMIYDNWDDTWGQGMAQRSPEQEEAKTDLQEETNSDLDTNDGWGDENVRISASDDEGAARPPEDFPFNAITPVAVAETQGEIFSGVGETEPDQSIEKDEDLSEKKSIAIMLIGGRGLIGQRHCSIS
ncbi:hypothetical protein B0H11DRAFT_2242070 [Mycena galericulata]|nr:hypothetical protein B0H11DRAFT_2242070 [Mycena galericulata]